MGFFNRDQPDDAAPAAPTAPPHPALASLDTFRDASLADAAAAILVLGFSDAEPGRQFPASNITLRAQELFEPATGLKGSKLLMHFQEKLFGLVELEALGVLSRSLLIDVSFSSGSLPRDLMLTRRDRRALDSGAPERWMDVPADPA